jgi:hypothetical protein
LKLNKGLGFLRAQFGNANAFFQGEAQSEENMLNGDKTNLNTALGHYLKSGRQFGDGERFYLLGFEAALHARNRCKEFDQIASEMAGDLEELQRQYPAAAVEEPFAQEFQRGREYYQRLCDE